MDGAVSAKYQLPGEELDPDGLISLADDSDVQARRRRPLPHSLAAACGEHFKLQGEYFMRVRGHASSATGSVPLCPAPKALITLSARPHAGAV